MNKNLNFYVRGEVLFLFFAFGEVANSMLQLIYSHQFREILDSTPKFLDFRFDSQNFLNRWTLAWQHLLCVFVRTGVQ